jgi:hypothetical protein
MRDAMKCCTGFDALLVGPFSPKQQLHVVGITCLLSHLMFFDGIDATYEIKE